MVDQIKSTAVALCVHPSGTPPKKVCRFKSRSHHLQYLRGDVDDERLQLTVPRHCGLE